VPSIVGYETDGFSCAYAVPANTSYSWLAASPFRDSDGYTGTANASIYRAPSGAWVFDAGTMSWSWALDRPGFVDARIQKTTSDLLDVLSGQSAVEPPDTSTRPDCSDTRTFSFEGGSFTSDPGSTPIGGDRTVGSVILETANPINGSFSMRLPGATDSYLETRLVPVDDADIQLLFRPAARPSSDVRMLLLKSGFTSAGNVTFRSSGVLCLRYGTTYAGGSTGNSCTKQGLTPGTTYRLRVHEVRGTGNDGLLEAFVTPMGTQFGSPFARTTSGTWTSKLDRMQVGSTTTVALDGTFDDLRIAGTTAGPPEAPSDLSATAPAASTRVDLSWTDNSASETGFLIERSTSSNFETETSFSVRAGTTSYSDTTVEEGTPYWYRVIAVNSAGSSTPSNVVDITVRQTPPAAPTGLAADWRSGTETVLTWADNASNETAYVVERAGNANFDNAVQIRLPADTVSYDDSGLAEGVYFYRVRSSNDSSVSAWSNVVTGSRIKDITFEDAGPTLLGGSTGVSRVVGTVVQETATPLRDSYSATIPNSAGSYVEQTLNGSDDFYASLYVRLAGRPSTDQRIVQLLNGTTTVGNLTLRATGQVCLKYGTAWSGGSATKACTLSTSPLQVGVTYRLAIRQKRGDGTGNAVVQAYWSGNDPTLPPGQTGPLAQFASTTLAPADAGYWQGQVTKLRVGATLDTVALNGTVDNIKLDRAFMPSAG
jgi:hypothetical protein